ncbi:hypothetical protein chiPu_0019645 [Chiloscyllium punctatum]|uniref:General vesicular transport factor p115 n=1 Tax=Chiloscyllium punctatum TaxID=137246 RepID=A0A401RSS4_CHIPU|nr:hypothetical protein [Chiloscyllium punctatum]
MNFLRGVMGGQSAGPQPSGAETVQKLCDRVASSTLLEDRRDAVRALKALSKKYRLEVGSQAMEHLVNVLQTDRLVDLTNSLEKENVQKASSEDLAGQFAEIYIKQQENLTLLLSLLEEFDFHVRWPAVKLLTALLKNQGPQVQQIILVSPMGIVVEDCLLLLLNLMKNNSSNQNFFKEGSYIQRTKPWFEVAEDNSGWSAQKVTNLHLMLQLVRVLVSPVNPPGATSSCQKSAFQCGLLQQLCTILMATGVPADILTELTPGNLSMTEGANSISAGQLLCGGLFSTDSLSNWCAAVALAHALQDNSIQKEQLLRVQLATSLGNPPVSLLQQCTNILSQGSKEQTRVGLLMLLSTWMTNCPIAVTHFLHNQTNVPFLTAQISENLGEEEQLVQGLCALLLGICIYYNENSLENYTKEKLKQLIEKRIGKEIFIEKLAYISKHELYSRAGQKPQPSYNSPEQMLFDHDFTKLVKELEVLITKAIQKSSEDEKKEEEVKKSLEQHDSIVNQYKELIREQDLQLNELKKQVTALTNQNEHSQTTITQQASQIQQLRDQYNLLKIQGKPLDSQHHIHNEAAQINGIQPKDTEEIGRLQEEIEELKKQHNVLEGQLAEKELEINKLRAAQSTGNLAEVGTEIAGDQPTDQHKLVGTAEALVRDNDGDSAAMKTAQLENRLSVLDDENKMLKDQLKMLTEEKKSLDQQLASTNSTIAILETDKRKLQQEVTESKKEQDDLLVLLADQDQKIFGFKNRLKELGEPVEDEDDLESADQEDDDDDDDDPN